MNFSFDHTQAKTPDSIRGNRVSSSPRMQSNDILDSSDNNRLQKAIERNRARQSRRDNPTARSTTPIQARGNLSERLNAKFGSVEEKNRTTRRSVSEESFAMPKEEFIRASSKKKVAQPSVASPRTRERVATRGTTRFSSVSKKESTLPAPVRYLGLGDVTVKTKNKKKLKKGWIDYFVMMGWIFCIALSLRLIFSDRGVIDYYSKSSEINGKYHELEMINQENVIIAKEIEKIRESSRYQKKIVRDHLGFISPNEYLLVFATRRAPANSN